MLKLIAAYRAAPTLKNAQKVVSYGRKHPFSLCFLDADDAAALKAALDNVNWAG